MKRKLNFKMLAVLVSAVLLLGAVVDGTLAYLFTNSQPITNTFEAGHVGCVVSDYDETVTGTHKFKLRPDDETNTTVFIRATVVANWVKDGGVYWQNPEVEVSGKDWAPKDDGYFYYQPEVSPEGKTEYLNIEISGTKPDGYELQIKVLGEAIQSKPDDVVVTWDNGGMN